MKTIKIGSIVEFSYGHFSGIIGRVEDRKVGGILKRGIHVLRDKNDLGGFADIAKAKNIKLINTKAC